VIASFCAAIARTLRMHILLLLLPLLLLPRLSSAKTAGMVAIAIYPDRSGFSYEHIGNFVLNGKNEVALCSDASPIAKSDYHKLSKITLAPGMSLERDAKGVLMLTQGSAPPACVVPANLKYDKGDVLTVAELADRAVMEGQVLPMSDPPQSQITPLKPGTMLVFVSSADQELAEYLRANRAADVRLWQSYLAKFPSGSHTGIAKKSLAALYIQSARTDLAAYVASKGREVPEYARLKEARQLTDQARVLAPGEEINALGQKIHSEVLNISSASTKDLGLYLVALRTQTAGYSNLVIAEKLADAAFDIDPSSSENLDAERQAKEARSTFDKILRDSEAQITAQHLDEAIGRINPIRPFADENQKVSDDLHAIASLYLRHAKKLQETSDWPNVIADLQNALAIVSSPETQAMLSDAKKKAQEAADKAAADTAIKKSQGLIDSKNTLAAFEVLDDLPPTQHALVTDQIDALKDQYVQDAQKTAKNLQKANDPITGLSDEVGIQRAFGYLQRCSRLTNDQDVETREAILAEDLSAFYLRQGKKYAEKPDGTGVNIGWTYLSEALQYRSPSTLSAINDEMATARAAHLLKSRLSMRVDFRDQTSRREATDFASQLTDAMATGLESSRMNVKVIRAQETTQVQPNFQIVGEVIRNEKSTSHETVPKQSFYRFGQQQVPNPDWANVDEDLEKAKNNLESARSSLEGATARGKRKEIDQAQNTIQDDEKKVEDLRKKLNSIPQFLIQDQERPYTYTQINYHLKIVVELHFRILDGDGNEIVQTIPVTKENPKEYLVLEDVKPDDTREVRKEGEVPNEQDLLEQTQIAARDELIKTAKAKISELPAAVIAAADRKAQRQDNEGAAELYILYLNSTPVADTPERLRARQFLSSTFNFKDLGRSELTD
jgi:hypothetical protein